MYSVACRLAQTANMELTMPRLVGRQTTRNNVVASTASEYYKRAVWYPFPYCTLRSLRDKFLSHHLTLLKLVALVPSVMQSYDWNDIVDSCRLYQSQLSSEVEMRHCEWHLPTGRQHHYRRSTLCRLVSLTSSRCCTSSVCYQSQHARQRGPSAL